MNVWSEGGTVTLLGVLVVFVCLALIILLIMVLSFIMRDRKKAKPEPKAEVKFEEEMHKPMPAVPVVDVVQDELIAVLTAAVAAYMADEEQAPGGLVVRSYRRVSPDSAWARAGRNAQIYNKL